MDWTASAIKPGRRSLNRTSMDGRRARGAIKDPSHAKSRDVQRHFPQSCSVYLYNSTYSTFSLILELGPTPGVRAHVVHAGMGTRRAADTRSGGGPAALVRGGVARVVPAHNAAACRPLLPHGAASPRARATGARVRCAAGAAAARLVHGAE